RSSRPYGETVPRIAGCSAGLSGSEVTGWTGAAVTAGVDAVVSLRGLPWRIERRGEAAAGSPSVADAVRTSCPPRLKSQYAKPKPEMAPRKLLSLVRSRLKHGLKNAPFIEEHTVSPRANSVPGGRCMNRVGPVPWILT